MITIAATLVSICCLIWLFPILWTLSDALYNVLHRLNTGIWIVVVVLTLVLTWWVTK